MNSKINQRGALWLLNAGLLISSLAASNVMAAECGASLVGAGSAGVNVSKNTCQQQSKLSAGSVVELAPGGRMWLKFEPNTTGESFQLICQNKSADAVSVNVTGAAAPWINPQGLKKCEQWSNNKLSCESHEGEKNRFFCAVASAKSGRSSAGSERTTSVTMKEARPERTTSVKMRSITLPMAVPVEEVIDSIKPDIELCKSLYGVSQKLAMSWTVSLGVIKDLNVNSDNQDLIACVEGVVKQANANQDVSINHSF